MKSIFVYICLVCLCLTKLQAQTITSLGQIKANKKYLLENTNGYGYAIYNPQISDKDVELGGAVVIHSLGCANDQYLSPVDPNDANNQWRITPGEKNTYYLYNLGAKKYLTDLTMTWNWWGEGVDYGNFYFTDEQTEVDIISVEDGVWAFRLTGAAGAMNANQKYMCAASHAQSPIAAWEIGDAGCTWYIKEVVEELAQSITLNVSNLTLTAGNSFTLSATVLPATAPGAGMVEWASDNEGVATVSKGVVTAIKPGVCTITASVPDGSNLKATCTLTVSESESKDEPLGTLRYFTLKDGQLVVIPEKYILKRSEENNVVSIELKGDTTFTFTKGKLASEDTIYNGDLPVFESFKFNNKFNDQLYSDVDGVIDNDRNTIDLTVACIGKRLTPSFKVPEGAHVYVDNQEQHSKVTRRRFDEDLTYTLAYPKNWIYRVEKISDEVWSTPETTNTEDQWIITPVQLTESMLSSNWPSENLDQQIGFLLDGNVDTYFHSNWSASNNWSEGSHYGDGKTIWPYLQIDLPESIENLQFSYTTRNWDQHNGYSPQGFIIMASQDGTTWEEVGKLDKDKDNLPAGVALQYTSPIILLGQPYQHLRFQLTESTRKNYLVLSEFAINKVTENPNFGKTDKDFVPELLFPAVYKQGFMPFGRDYKVHVDYLTDHPTSEYSVPRIDITFGDGKSWNGSNWIGRHGKEFWEEATIRIDGAGVFPDMEEDSILIRGRGNSSWSSSYSSKNPYRIKFNKKAKPFGMTKGKNWVLLANKQSGSLTTNAIAMKTADMVGSAACNHIIPVELYVNNQYRGSYNFTEKIGFAGNSIDIEDESNAVILELDSYYDEPYRFHSSIYYEPVNVKFPNFTDEDDVAATNLSFQDIQYAFNTFDEAVWSGDYPAMLDIDAFCRAMLVTDLTRNTEVQHPKSWYIYNENILADSAWVFGPVWDFDWSYGYENHNQYFIYDAETDLFNYNRTGIPFFREILRGSDVTKKHYYKVWTEFLNAGKLDELIEFCDDYMEYANPSFVHNNSKWGDGRQYANVTEKAKSWLTKRANYIYSHLEKYDVSDDIIDQPEDFDYGQPDRIDIARIINKPVDVYTLNGIRIRTRVPYINCTSGLMPGIYIVEGKKVIIK